MTKDHEEAVRAVRFVGESLIKNTESIVGSEELFQGLKIHIKISLGGCELPSIIVERGFIPERSFEIFEESEKDYV